MTTSQVLERRLAVPSVSRVEGEGRLQVTVRGDGLSYYQNVAAVMTACQQAGISEMGIAVSPGASPLKER